MIEVCFSQNVRTLLCLAKNFGVELGDIALFPDDLTLGSLSNMSPQQRRSELEKLSIHPAEDFEEQYTSFVNTVSHASELRVWYANMPYEILACIYTCFISIENAAICSIDVNASELMDENGVINPSGICEGIHSLPVDAVRFKQIWSDLVRDNALLRTVDGWQPASHCLDFFDDLINDAIASCGSDDLENIGMAAFDLCAQSPYGFMNPEFFMGRAKLLCI